MTIFLDWSNLKVIADEKINATQKLKFGLGRAETIVGKGENAGYQHFLLYQQCFQKATFNLKATADNKIKVTQNLKFGVGRAENIVGKGEYAGYQYFLLFPQCF